MTTKILKNQNQLLKNLFFNVFQRLLKLRNHCNNQYTDQHESIHFQEGIMNSSHFFLMQMNLEKHRQDVMPVRMKKMQGMLLQAQVTMSIVLMIVS